MNQQKLPQDYDYLKIRSPLDSMRFFCPKRDWSVETLERVFALLEGLIPDMRIGWELKFIPTNRKVNGQWEEDFHYKNIDLGEDRIGFMRKRLGQIGQTEFWNGDLNRFVKVGYCVASRKLPDRKDNEYIGYTVDVYYPLDALNRERTFKAVGTACRALYATECLQPVDVAQQLMFVNTILRRDMKGINQLYPQYHSVADELALSLPHLMPPTYLASISVVERLLWMNYWHPDTAAFYGFPDPEKDARLLPLAEQLPNGAWFFKLTEDPLDTTRADHREALVWAYRRFQPVGQPVEPSQMNVQAQQNKTFSAEQFRELARKSGENLDPAAQKQMAAQTEQFLALVEAIKAKVQKNNPQ